MDYSAAPLLDNEDFTSMTHGEVVRPSLQVTQVVDMSATGSYMIQYNLIYRDRCQRLSKRFKALHPCPVSRIQGQCTISGVIKKKYKATEKKIGTKKSSIPLAVDEYVQPFILYGDDDIVEIEDESGKIRLLFTETTKIHYSPGSINLAKSKYKLEDLPFGVVVAINGHLDESLGRFVCNDIMLPSMPQGMVDIGQMSLEEVETKVLIASDLDEDAYNTLITFLSQDNSLLPTLCCLIICGNLYRDTGIKQGQRYQKLDYYLEKLTQIISVVVVSDLQSSEWPQKPLPALFLNKSRDYAMRSHNPSILKMGQTRILITNGQNITESMRVSPLVNPIDIMESHLEYNHFAPYAPSSFKTIPLKTDVFALDFVPEIYIVGRQNKFQTKLYKNSSNSCRMVMVPPFEDGMVEINLRTLEAKNVRVSYKN